MAPAMNRYQDCEKSGRISGSAGNRAFRGFRRIQAWSLRSKLQKQIRRICDRPSNPLRTSTHPFGVSVFILSADYADYASPVLLIQRTFAQVRAAVHAECLTAKSNKSKKSKNHEFKREPAIRVGDEPN
jgi:hypothetical protein